MCCSPTHHHTMGSWLLDKSTCFNPSSHQGQLLLDKSADVRSMAVGETIPADALQPGLTCVSYFLFRISIYIFVCILICLFVSMPACLARICVYLSVCVCVHCYVCVHLYLSSVKGYIIYNIICICSPHPGTKHRQVQS